jgi:hypothetical protein
MTPTSALVEQLAEVSRRQTAYFKARRGDHIDEFQALDALIYLVGKSCETADLTDVDRRLLLDRLAHSVIPEPEKLRRFYSALFTALTLDDPTHPDVIAELRTLLRP